MLKSLPVQLFLALVGGLLLGDFLSNDTISYFYTFSCILKEILMLILPLVIFSYLFAAILSFEKQAPLLILAVVVLVIISNALTVLTAYGIGLMTLPFITSCGVQQLAVCEEVIKPLWRLGLPSLLSPERALIAGILAGFIASVIKSPVYTQTLRKVAFTLRDLSTFALKKGFIPFLPLYVLGFVLKLDRDGAMSLLVQNYGQVFILSCLIITTYLILMYAIAARFKWEQFISYMKEMIPAGLTGFSTMSSAASMPVTLAATEKNTGDQEYADFVIPTTVNIHLVGDGLNIALTGLALLLMSGKGFPDFTSYLTFTVYYCLAKFSCAGIPGGGVIVILPVIQTYLGLSPEVTSMLATIYILQDPILTGANVMGNGAFAIITRRIMEKLRLISSPKHAF